MSYEVTIVVSPHIASDSALYLPIAARRASISLDDVAMHRIKRKSIDARGAVKINMTVELFTDSSQAADEIRLDYKDVSSSESVAIIGSGPAGLFAALRLIELGLRPIVIERGREVSARKRDVALINRGQDAGEDSNYCFGEGGAGTFSDGKLYTRSKKRGNFRRSLEILHHHGAHESILYDAHPHIGTEVLPRVITAIRNTIEHFGGKVYFDSRVVDIEIKDDAVASVTLASGDKIASRAVVLATGHSARDVYFMLNNKGVLLESKPFAMGVRIEHPQELIDSIQYKMPHRGDYLPAASYSLVAQVGGRGVYSFCMCPGGFIVPAATAAGEAVVNGMSPSKRNSQYANSGLVTEIRVEDYAHLVPEHGVLAGLVYQMEYEKRAFEVAGGMQKAPAQRVTDFISGKLSQSLPSTSYHPGGTSAVMKNYMEPLMYSALRGGLLAFDRKMRGYVTSDALMIGAESRTSSPVRIPRDRDTLEHPQLKGLYPTGEGAGFAGGIISSAVDGQRVAESIARSFGISVSE